MNPKELLILNRGDFLGGSAVLFRQLNESPVFRDQFIRDPAGTLSTTIFAERTQPSVGTINQANRIFFALLTNPKFVAWARDFQQRMQAEIAAADQPPHPTEALPTGITTL